MHTCIDRIGQIYYMIFDAAILSVVPFVALLLRLDGDTSSDYFNVLLNIVLIGVVIKIAVFSFYGIYNRIWRYATIKDMFAIIGACTISGVIIALLGLCLDVGLPRSIYIISYILDVGLICFSRLVVRMLLLMNQQHDDALENSLVIIGAGDAGAMIAREMIQRGESKKLVGFLDDDSTKVGKKILGYTVLGVSDDIDEIAAQN